MKILVTLVCLVCIAGPLTAQWSQTGGPDGIIVISAAQSSQGVVFVSQAGDFYRQDGTSWQKFATLSGAGRMQILDNVLYVLKNQQMYRSADDGKTWTPVPVTGTITKGNGKLYSVTNDSLFLSNDQGASWQLVDTVTFFTQTVTPSNQYLVANVAGFMPQILRSSDGGIEWVDAATPPAALGFNTSVVDIISDPAGLYALLNNGEIYVSTDDGNTWSKAVDAPTADAITYTKLIKSGSVFWVESGYGIYLWNGSSWGIPINTGSLVAADAQTAIVRSYQGVFQVYSDIDKIDIMTNGFKNAGIYNLLSIKGALYASAHNGLHRSVDLGASWTKVGTLAPFSMTSDETSIYAHAYEGLYHSTDDGLTWTHLATPRDDEWQDVTSITSDGENIYVSYGKTFGEHGQTNWVSGGMLRSSDHGATWQSISNGLPANIETHVPVNQAVWHNNTLFITTLQGIFRSDNKGASWMPFDAGIAYASFRSGIFVSGGNKLYFSHANAYYMLEGASWVKVPEIDADYMFFGAYGGYATGLGDSLFATAYKYDASTQTSTYRSLIFNGAAWTDLTPAAPQGVVLNSFIRVHDRFMAGSMYHSVWKIGITQDVREPAHQELSVYPNPAREKIQLSHYEGPVTIFDLLGRQVSSMHIGFGETVNVSYLPSGSYSIRYTGADGLLRYVRFAIR